MQPRHPAHDDGIPRDGPVDRYFDCVVSTMNGTNIRATSRYDVTFLSVTKSCDLSAELPRNGFLELRDKSVRSQPDLRESLSKKAFKTVYVHPRSIFRTRSAGST